MQHGGLSLSRAQTWPTLTVFGLVSAQNQRGSPIVYYYLFFFGFSVVQFVQIKCIMIPKSFIFATVQTMFHQKKLYLKRLRSYEEKTFHGHPVGGIELDHE